ADLSLLLDAWARAAERLSPAPDSLRRLPLLPMPTDGFRNFAAAAAGEAPPPELPDPCAGRLEQLAEWEGNLAASIDADEVIHGDLRLDNMVLGADRAWICDWTMPNLGASWFDTAVFLVTAHGDGHPAEALFWSHPTSAGVTDEQLDSVLAAVAGYCLCNSRKPLIDGVSPYVRRHQRWSGLATLDWLARRRGW
ncbi:MAG: phosphotransferase, partial [Geminicoccales bacterium]